MSREMSQMESEMDTEAENFSSDAEVDAANYEY